MPSSHLILCCLLLLLPSIFPSIRIFSNESALRIRWPKYWSFSFNISPSNEHPGLISFRMDSLGLFAVQGTLKSLLQHHRSKASILRRSAFFIVQLSHPYVTTGKAIALTRWTFVGKVMSLLFNMLCKLVITFLPRSKCRYTWFHFTFTFFSSSFIILRYIKKKKSPAIVHVSQSSCKEPGAMERTLGWKIWDSLFTHSFTLEQSLLPSFLIHNLIIILSPCLSVRDVVRLRKTTVWKQFLFLCHLPLSISTPPIPGFFILLYINVSIFSFPSRYGFHPLLWRRS